MTFPYMQHNHPPSKVLPIARVSYWVYYGSDPPFDIWDMSKRVVLTCQTPACFNPDHVKVVREQAGVNKLMDMAWRARKAETLVA